jgi:hypothetical protein
LLKFCFPSAKDPSFSIRIKPKGDKNLDSSQGKEIFTAESAEGAEKNLKLDVNEKPGDAFWGHSRLRSVCQKQ